MWYLRKKVQDFFPDKERSLFIHRLVTYSHFTGTRYGWSGDTGNGTGTIPNWCLSLSGTSANISESYTRTYWYQSCSLSCSQSRFPEVWMHQKACLWRHTDYLIEKNIRTYHESASLAILKACNVMNWSGSAAISLYALTSPLNVWPCSVHC